MSREVKLLPSTVTQQLSVCSGQASRWRWGWLFTTLVTFTPQNESCSLPPNTALCGIPFTCCLHVIKLSLSLLSFSTLPPLRPVLLQVKDPDSRHTFPTAWRRIWLPWLGLLMAETEAGPCHGALEPCRTVPHADTMTREVPSVQ